MLGLLQQDAEAWLQAATRATADIEALIAARNAARKAKNFAEADRIRTDLALRVSCSRTAPAARPGVGQVRVVRAKLTLDESNSRF